MEESTEKLWDDKLEAYRDLSRVHSSIKEDDITQDYIYATLEDNEKELVQDMYNNAKFAKNIVLQAVKWVIETRKIPETCSGKKECGCSLHKEVKDIIKEANMTFNLYMDRMACLIVTGKLYS